MSLLNEALSREEGGFPSMSLFLSSFSCWSPFVTFLLKMYFLFICKMKKSERVFYQNLRESPAGCQRSTDPSPCTEGKTPPLSLPRGPKDHRREARQGQQLHSDQLHHLPFSFLSSVYQCSAVLQTCTLFASLQVNKLTGRRRDKKSFSDPIKIPY